MDQAAASHGRNLDTETLQRLDNHVVHPWENFGGMGEHKRLVIERGEDVHVIDSDGNRMLDGPAGMWCVNAGYGREEIANAIADQAMQLAQRRAFEEGRAGVLDKRSTLYFKAYATEEDQRRDELLLAILGTSGLGWEGEGFSEDELQVARQFLTNKSLTIGGGTTEIQLNVIAKALGLPQS